MGTIVNVATVVVGALLGIVLGNRIPERTKETVTSVLGLFTLVIGGLSVVAMNSEALKGEVGSSAMIVVLAALLVGAVLGTWLQVEYRLEQFATWIRSRFAATGDAARFVDGMVTSTLLFCVGPLAILVLLGIHLASPLYFEAALLIALMGFVGTVALAKFLLRGDIIE